jgi:hypothetical protein
MDYRPISVMHAFAKLITKIAANKLAPKLENIISITQNAFLNKMCIIDNFMFVQQLINDLHKTKPRLFS